MIPTQSDNTMSETTTNHGAGMPSAAEQFAQVRTLLGAPVAGKADEMPDILMCPDCDIPAYIHPGVTETGTGGANCERCGRAWGEAVDRNLDFPCDLAASRTDENFTCMQSAGHDGPCDMVITGKGMGARDDVGRDKLPGLEIWAPTLRIARSMKAEGVWSMKPGEPSQAMGCVVAFADDRERLLARVEDLERSVRYYSGLTRHLDND